MRSLRPGPLAFVGALAGLAPLPPSSAYSSLRRLDGLGKWKDGEPTEIDCSASSHDYEYYIERCIDSITQWWINGRCIGGRKEEVSELHRCMKPDESRPFCHDCDDGRGNVKNVCGSDKDDKDEVCGIAWSGSAEDCGDQGLTVYAHQCVARSGGAGHWYLREDYWCDQREVYLNGPCMEEVPPRTEFVCGESWYYQFEEDDPNVAKLDRAVPSEDARHPFANSSNRYCLDCGMAIQVCHAGEAGTTCEDLGLAPKGVDSCALCGTPGAGAAPVEAAPVDVDESNEAAQADESNEAYQAEETDESTEVDQADGTEQADDADQADQVEDEVAADQAAVEEAGEASEAPAIASSDSEDAPDGAYTPYGYDALAPFDEVEAAVSELTPMTLDSQDVLDELVASIPMDGAAEGSAPPGTVLTVLSGGGTSDAASGAASSSPDKPKPKPKPKPWGTPGGPGDVDPLEIPPSSARSIRSWGAVAAAAAVGGICTAFA